MTAKITGYISCVIFLGIGFFMESFPNYVASLRHGHQEIYLIIILLQLISIILMLISFWMIIGGKHPGSKYF